MKKNLFTLALLVVLSIGKAQNCPTYNINGGFESMAGSGPVFSPCIPSNFSVSLAAGWKSILSADVFNSSGTACLTAARIHSGTYAAGFSMQSNNHEYIYTSAGTLINGATYKIKAYIKLEGGLTPASSTVGFWALPIQGHEPWQGDFGNNQLPNPVWTYESSTGWYAYEASFTATTGTIPYTICISSFSTAYAYICVDDISLSLSNPSLIIGNTAGGTTVCQPACVGITAIGQGGAAPYTYSWSNGVTTASQNLCTPGFNQVLTVTLTDKAGCKVSGSRNVVIHSAPPISAGLDITICKYQPGGTIGYPATCGKGNPKTYQWTPAAGLSCPTCCYTYATPASTTNYTVTATDQITGCTASDQVKVTVTNCGSETGRESKPQHTAQPQAGERMVTEPYPNPSSGQMQCDYSLQEGEQGAFVILDVMGKQLSSYSMSEDKGTLRINESLLPAGIYFYQVIVNREVVKTAKISIVR